MNLSFQLKWVVVVFGLSATIALLIGDRKSSLESLSLSFEEYDQIIKSPVARISAVELATLLMAQKQHYNLVDLQGAEADYQIPTSESFGIESFLAENIPVNETIIIYSKNEVRALQLYYLLLIRGYFKIVILSGGMSAWQQEILQPQRSKISESEFEARSQLTRFFGGRIVGAANQASEPGRSPVLLEKKKKHHRGC